MKNKLIVVSVLVLALVASAVYATQNKQKLKDQNSTVMPTITVEEQHDEYGEPAGETDSTAFMVTVEDGKFAPDGATIKLETPIIFENEEKEPIEIVGDGGVNTGPLKHEEKSKPTKYETTGTYTYHVKSNPEVTGTVKVIE